MPVPIETIPFIGRRKRRRIPQAAPPAPLELVAATYETALWVDLTFSRAVNVSGIVGSAIVIYDGELASLVYTGTGTVSQPSPTTVRVGLVGGRLERAGRDPRRGRGQRHRRRGRRGGVGGGERGGAAVSVRRRGYHRRDAESAETRSMGGNVSACSASLR